MKCAEKPLGGKGKEAPEAIGKAAPKSPLAEGIRLGVPGERGGPYSICIEVRGRNEIASAVGASKAEMEARGRKELPGIVFANEHFIVGGKHVHAMGQGLRGPESAYVFVYDPDGEKGDAMLDLLGEEEGSFSAGETECKVRITSPLGAAKAGPRSASKPTHYAAIEGEAEYINSAVLSPGESMGVEGEDIRIIVEKRDGELSVLKIEDSMGGTLIEDAMEGDRFELKRAGRRDLQLTVLTVPKKEEWIELLVTAEKK